jgi:hypothetical protein
MTSGRSASAPSRGRGSLAGHRLGHELIAAGLLLQAGPVDRDPLKEWVWTGYERGQGTWLGYGPSSPPGSRNFPPPDSCYSWAVGRPVKGEIPKGQEGVSALEG